MDLDVLERNYNFTSGQCFYPFETGRTRSQIPRLDTLASEAFLPLLNSNVFSTQALPNSVYQTLLSVAVQKRDSFALSILVKVWPMSVFRLQSETINIGETPQLTKSSHPKYPLHSSEGIDFMGRQEKFNLSLCVIHSFLDMLRNGGVSNIKVLDLRGFPLSNVGVDYLTCQGMLSYVEHERNKILQAVGTAVNSGRITAEEAVPFGDLKDLQSSTTPGINCVIIIDCFIGLQGSEFTNLCKWLTVSGFEASPLKVIVDKLRLSDGFDIAVNLLLDLTKRRPLRGIGIARMGRYDLEQILPHLQNLSNSLECLDMTKACINFPNEFRLSTMFVEFLQSLVRLQRLDLMQCSLKRMLKKFLSVIPNGLTYLNLRDTDLAEMDLIYLSSSFHCRTLTELILCGNDFSSSTSSLCCLLKECRNSLKFLDLEGCSLHSSQAERIFANLSYLQVIEYIDLTNNVFDRHALTVLAPTSLKSHETLHYLWLPYPAYEFVSPSPDQLYSRENVTMLNAWTDDFDSLMKHLFDNCKIRVKCIGVCRVNYANLQNA